MGYLRTNFSFLAQEIQETKAIPPMLLNYIGAANGKYIVRSGAVAMELFPSEVWIENDFFHTSYWHRAYAY